MSAPTPELDERFGDATEPMAWEEVERALEHAEIYWISTVRADGQPHVTPTLSVRLDGVQHLCTGVTEQKARNLERQPRCTLLSASSDHLAEGLDVMVEATAVRIADEARLHELSDAWVAKYGDDWRFGVVDAAFHSDEGGAAPVFALEPSKVLAFTRGTYSQTRFRF